jgi:hypothetical protein
MHEYMKKTAVAIVLEQLKLRGEDAILADKLSRYDILIKDKDIKIKIKVSKLKQRSKSAARNWEFTKLIHCSRLYPVDIFDFYILIGFGDNGDIKKIWKMSTDDNMIYRTNQIFIPINNCGKYKKYELGILEDPSSEFIWLV